MKEVRIKDICNKASSSLKQKDVQGKEGKYPVYGASGVISYIDSFHQEKEYIGLVKDGAGIGRIMFLPPKSSIIGTMQYILPKDGYDINYIGYCLKSLGLSQYQQGAAIPHIYFRNYGERIVNIEESIENQRTIVRKLNSAFEKIDTIKQNAQNALNQAKKLFQKQLAESLEGNEGWEHTTLKDVSIIAGNYGLSVPSKPYNGVRYLRITDITELGDLNEDKVSANLTDDSDQNPLIEGDVLFARTGATVGKTLIYKKEFGKCLFAGYLIRYRLNISKLLPRFLYYITHSTLYYKWVIDTQKVAAQPNINAKLYNSLPLCFPKEIKEQQRIIDTLDCSFVLIQKLKSNLDKITEQCEMLKTALLKQSFE